MKTLTINTIEEALTALGVTDSTLSDQEKKALDEQGYLLVRGALNTKQLKDVQLAFEKLCQEEKKTANSQTAQESGTRHINGVISKSAVFDCIYTHPKLLAAVYYVLKAEFRTSGLYGRDPLPGYGQQALHADWGQRALSQPFQVVTTLTMLDDFTVQNGAIRIVPGSHWFYEAAHKKFKEPKANHPDQMQVVAPAGTMLIFNGHLWHSGMRNNSQSSRRALLGGFGLNSYTTISEAELEMRPDLAPAARYILGV